jgi:polysaccharide biosynthesis/export protein
LFGSSKKETAVGSSKEETAVGSSKEETAVGSSKEETAPTDFKKNPTEINWDYAVISRLNHADLKTNLLTFQLGLAISDPLSSANLALEPGDVLTVFSQADIPVSIERQDRYVQVEGEVNAPGVYQVKPNQTLRDVVSAAGGLTSHAYLYAAELRRESTRLEQQERLKQLVARLKSDMSARNASAASRADPEEIASQKSRLAEQDAYLEKISQVTPTGRVVLDIKPQGGALDDLPALPLEDHDVIRIPSRGGTVEVFGAVNNENALIYHEKTNVSDYLAKAGGTTRESDEGRLFVIRADGSVVAKQGHSGPFGTKIESMLLMPGDAIVVPNKLSRTSFMQGLRDWSQVFSQFALGAAAAKILGQ